MRQIKLRIMLTGVSGPKESELAKKKIATRKEFARRREKLQNAQAGSQSRSARSRNGCAKFASYRVIAHARNFLYDSRASRHIFFSA